MTPEQEQQLQHFEIEIQIAEKQLRLSQIKKQTAETELDIVGLHRELDQHMNHDAALVA